MELVVCLELPREIKWRPSHVHRPLFPHKNDPMVCQPIIAKAVDLTKAMGLRVPTPFLAVDLLIRLTSLTKAN